MATGAWVTICRSCSRSRSIACCTSLRSVMLRATACRPAKRPSSLTQLRALAHPQVLALAGQHGELAVGVRDPLLALVLVEAPGLLAVVRAHHVEEGPPEQLALRAAERLLGGGVRVGEAALGVGAEDDVVGQLDELAEAGLARREPRGDGALARELPLPLDERTAGLGRAATQPERPQGKEHGGDGQDGREGEARRHAVGKLLNGQQ